MADSGFITASHCAHGTMGTGPTGPMYQNTAAYGQDSVGTIEINPVWDVVDDRCNGYSTCAKADAMYVRFTDHTAWAARVAKTNSIGSNYASGSTTVSTWWTSIPYVAGEYVGQPLEKVGRTTGWTGGTMAQSCVNLSKPSEGWTVICAHKVTGSKVGPGDSGSPVFRRISNSIYPVGVLFAGVLGTGGQCIDSTCYYWFSNWNYVTTTHLQRQFAPTN